MTEMDHWFADCFWLSSSKMCSSKFQANCRRRPQIIFVDSGVNWYYAVLRLQNDVWFLEAGQAICLKWEGMKIHDIGHILLQFDSMVKRLFVLKQHGACEVSETGILKGCCPIAVHGGLNSTTINLRFLYTSKFWIHMDIFTHFYVHYL